MPSSADAVIVTTPLPLEYAPPWRWYRRRRPWVLAAVVVASMSGCAWHWRHFIAARATLLYWQHKCMTYEPPPDLTVFETDISRFDSLQQSNAGYWMPQSKDFIDLRREFWRKYPAGRWEPGPAFCHRLRTPSGLTRLVAVDLSNALLPDALCLFPRVVIPAGLLSDPQGLRTPAGSRFGFVQLEEGQTVRVFAGQLDPADSSHFTIDFELSEDGGVVRHTIDGWLRESGTVDLLPRDPKGEWWVVKFGDIRRWSSLNSRARPQRRIRR